MDAETKIIEHLVTNKKKKTIVHLSKRGYLNKYKEDTMRETGTES